MQKEIYEQPRAITDTIGTRVIWHEGRADLDLDGIDFSPEKAEGDRARPSRRVRHRVLRRRWSAKP